MTKEALTLALEAAYLAGFNASGEGYNGEYPFDDTGNNPAENNVWIKARDNYIKEALAQTEQDPVAWMSDEIEDCDGDAVHDFSSYQDNHCKNPLYTTPPQRKPLTDEEIGAILEGVNAYGTRLYTFARAIEVAHNIKE